MLQGLIFGYAGLDITPEGIRQVNSEIPANIKSITVKTPRAHSPANRAKTDSGINLFHIQSYRH